MYLFRKPLSVVIVSFTSMDRRLTDMKVFLPSYACVICNRHEQYGCDIDLLGNISFYYSFFTSSLKRDATM